MYTLTHVLNSWTNQKKSNDDNILKTIWILKHKYVLYDIAIDYLKTEVSNDFMAKLDLSSKTFLTVEVIEKQDFFFSVRSSLKQFSYLIPE